MPEGTITDDVDDSITETGEENWTDAQIFLLKRCCRFLVPLRLTKMCQSLFSAPTIEQEN